MSFRTIPMDLRVFVRFFTHRVSLALSLHKIRPIFIYFAHFILTLPAKSPYNCKKCVSFLKNPCQQKEDVFHETNSAPDSGRRDDADRRHGRTGRQRERRAGKGRDDDQRRALRQGAGRDGCGRAAQLLFHHVLRREGRRELHARLPRAGWQGGLRRDRRRRILHHPDQHHRLRRERFRRHGAHAERCGSQDLSAGRRPELRLFPEGA